MLVQPVEVEWIGVPEDVSVSSWRPPEKTPVIFPFAFRAYIDSPTMRVVRASGSAYDPMLVKDLWIRLSELDLTLPSIATFVRRYGLLLPCDSEAGHLWIGETADFWVQEIRALGGVIADVLAVQHSSTRSVTPDVAQKRQAVTTAIESRLRGRFGHYGVRLPWKGSRWTLQEEPACLLGAIWLQTARWAAGLTKYRRCENPKCREWFKPPTKRRRYCSQRCSLQGWRLEKD
jgi:hypothetical protein